MKPFSMLSVWVLMLFASCSKEAQINILTKPTECDTTTVFYYNRDVKPLIALNCSGPTCHIPGTTNVNYDFTDYNVLANRIQNGVFEYRLLLPMDDPQHMPQTGPPYPMGYNLSSCDLYKIRAWIKQGYPNN